LSSKNQEEATSGTTGKKNMITIVNSAGQAFAPGDYIKIVFFGTDKNYITNPGVGAFFVKINDYDVDGATSGSTSADINPATANNTHIVDGGVTVANVMNESIQIQTKVLETMDFSVGTVDPDTLTSDGTTTAGSSNLLYSANGHTAHGGCDLILKGMTPATATNSLSMGDTNSEDSLKTNKSFATHSYWRLSSNSSGGATVYYAGNTLSNTEGDKIRAIGVTAASPIIGTEQFGLALDNTTSGNNYGVSYAWAKDSNGDGSGLMYETGADTGITGLDSAFTTYAAASSGAVHSPQLYPLAPTTNYAGGTGGINSEDTTINSSYAFDTTSQTVPTAIATENSQVVNCVTGKMRYIANIAATTPAGIYTTKINYIAAPQY
jgi:hypothetical protein